MEFKKLLFVSSSIIFLYKVYTLIEFHLTACMLLKPTL